MPAAIDARGRRRSRPPPAGTLEGIGLGNTRSRLRMLFGDAARLELSAIPDGGTRAEVRLPYTEHVA